MTTTTPDTANEQPAAERCPHCRTGSETFRCFGRMYRFDVDLAREITQDGRTPLELEPDDVAYSLKRCHIYEQHVDHVNPIYPGIVAHYWYPEPDGQIAHGHLLIDGHHRAARCQRDGLPYYVYILSEEESRAVTLTAPDPDEVYAQAAQHQSEAHALEPELAVA